MTEEIIIDGVNVVGCEYMLNNKIKGKQHCPAKTMPYAKETSCICRKSIDTPYNFCKHNPNCHYKQLKRLEQSNKELIEDNLNLYKENKELKEENIKVKKEFNNLITEIISDIEYTGEITCDGESPKEHLKKCQKALTLLEEIREIANYMADDSDDYIVCCEGIEKIKNKINEVLNG